MITGLVHVPRHLVRQSARRAPGDRGDEALEALADTLSALVGGVAAGLVGDAVVIVPAPDPDVAAIAEATGATLVVAAADPWRAGAAAARRDWLLCLAAGDVPAEGWVRAVDRFVVAARSERALGRLRRGGVVDLFGRLRDRLGPWDGPRAGDVVRRDLVLDPGARPRVRRLPAAIERR